MPYKSSATVTSKGQVTVPADIRERLGLKAGDRLDFHLTDSGKLSVVATKRRSILESRESLPATDPRSTGGAAGYRRRDWRRDAGSRDASSEAGTEMTGV